MESEKVWSCENGSTSSMITVSLTDSAKLSVLSLFFGRFSVLNPYKWRFSPSVKFCIADFLKFQFTYFCDFLDHIIGEEVFYCAYPAGIALCKAMLWFEGCVPDWCSEIVRRSSSRANQRGRTSVWHWQSDNDIQDTVQWQCEVLSS